MNVDEARRRIAAYYVDQLETEDQAHEQLIEMMCRAMADGIQHDYNGYLPAHVREWERRMSPQRKGA